MMRLVSGPASFPFKLGFVPGDRVYGIVNGPLTARRHHPSPGTPSGTSPAASPVTERISLVETKSLTYAELGAALGITPASAKRLAIRRGWPKTPGNDGKARVAVPIERLEVERSVSGDDTSAASGDDIGDVTGDDARDDTGDLSAAVAVLERHADRLMGELSDLRAKLVAVEGERDTERAKASQVAVLEAILELERQRLAEVRIEADRWRAAATTPRGVAAVLGWLRRSPAA